MTTATAPKKQTKREITIAILMSREAATLETFGRVTFIRYVAAGLNTCAMLYPNSSKPFKHYKYRTAEEMENAIISEKAFETTQMKIRETREAEGTKRKNEIAAGSILYSLWGYEQTNIDFYKILERKNDFVIIQEIGQDRKFEEISMQGSCIPNPEKTKGEPFRKKISKQGSINLNSFTYCSLWDGRPKYWSSYN